MAYVIWDTLADVKVGEKVDLGDAEKEAARRGPRVHRLSYDGA
jgi:hypothetical protein